MGLPAHAAQGASLLGQYVGANRFIRLNLLSFMPGGHLPDPEGADLNAFETLVDEVADELAAFDRFARRNPDPENSLEGLLLLPSELQQPRMATIFASAKSWIEGKLGGEVITTVSLGELVARMLGEQPSPGGRAFVDSGRLSLMAEGLARLGYGVEPDPLYTTTRSSADDPAFIYRLPEQQRQRVPPTTAYRQAVALATLVAGVAAANEGRLGTAEMRRLEWVEEANQLEENERRRLRAHVQWLLVRGRGLAMFKRLAREVPAEQRGEIARFAASVGAADGTASTEEVAALERIYDELGVIREKLYSDLHELLPPPEDAPARVPMASGQPRDSSPQVELFGLDSGRLANIRAETEAVADILGRIFVEDMPPSPAPVEAGSTALGPNELDAQHTKLLHRLIERTEWPRAEFEAVARSVGLMPAGALETINDWAIEQVDDNLLEGEDLVLINQDPLSKIRQVLAGAQQ
jgi:uncharacterized tellurite resistance protein B-like protein